MDYKQIASLGCKFLGIYSILQTIPLLGNVFQVVAFAKGDASLTISLLFSTFLPLFMMAVLGIALLLFSNKFAQKMVPENIEKDTASSLPTKKIQSIAFSIVGLVMIVLAIPKIFQIGWNIHSLQSAGDQRNTQELLMQNWSFTLATVIQFAIGIFLFIGSELLSSGWHFVVNRLKYEKNITNQLS